MRTLTGKVVLKRVNEGSKSESDGFFIAIDGGREVRIELDGEEPFEQTTLKSLVGKSCEATGVFYRTKFIAQTVKSI